MGFQFHIAVLLLVAVLSLSACGPTHPAIYQPVTPTAEESDWDRALVLERNGRIEEAAGAFEKICTATPPFERACFDRARLAYLLEEPEAAQWRSSQFIRQFPESALAPSAVDQIVESCVSPEQRRAARASLSDVADRLHGTDARDSVLYGAARLARRLGDRKNEKIALQEIAREGRWGSQLYDNAMWRLVEMAREVGDLDDEERLIRKMLNTRESSWIIGTYHSGLHDDALLRLGEILVQKNKLEEAYRTFHRLSTWETSRLRDDGLLRAAQVQQALGKTSSACRHLEELLSWRPEPRSAPAARELMSSWRCENHSMDH